MSQNRDWLRVFEVPVPVLRLPFFRLPGFLQILKEIEGVAALPFPLPLRLGDLTESILRKRQQPRFQQQVRCAMHSVPKASPTPSFRLRHEVCS